MGAKAEPKGPIGLPSNYYRVRLAAVGVVFYVDGVVHGGGGGVGFFVGGDLGFVLQAGADVVEAF